MKVLLKAGVIDVPNLCFEMHLIHRQVPGLSFFCGFWIFFFGEIFLKKILLLLFWGRGWLVGFVWLGFFCFEFDLFWSDFCFFFFFLQRTRIGITGEKLKGNLTSSNIKIS